MNSWNVARLFALLTLLVAGALVSAQVPLPSAPPRESGGSISPSFEGWFDNPDGTHTFLIGYYSRNTQAEVDVPIGPNNRFDPGPADQGQPTHFLTTRRFGMFTITVPKEFPRTQKLTWTLNTGGMSTSIPFSMNPDYIISPLVWGEEAPNGKFNTPPGIRFEERAANFVGPSANPLVAARVIARTATVGSPMPLSIWADDDALFSGGSGANLGSRPPVSLQVSNYRGPGRVTVTPPRITFETLKGGKPLEQFSGKATAGISFSAPGEYLVHLMALDYSGPGGGGSGCCWTNAFLKVAVQAAGGTTSGN